MNTTKIQEQRQISKFERLLNIHFPQSYRQFLLERGSAVIDGFKVMGLPTKEVPLSVAEGTSMLRKKRPDLPENLLVIIFIKNIVVCLDLSERSAEDAPMVEVDLESNKLPMLTDKTFSQWLEYHTKWEKRFRQAWTRIGNRQIEAEGKNRIQDWSAPIFRSKDYIITIGAFRFSYKFGCLEADEFLPLCDIKQ